MNNIALCMLLIISYDHQERLTAQEAMAHPFFEEVRTNEHVGGNTTNK